MSTRKTSSVLCWLFFGQAVLFNPADTRMACSQEIERADQGEGIAIKGLVVFGDSLSDNGNTWRLTHYYSGLPDPFNQNYDTNYFRDFVGGKLTGAISTVGPSFASFPVFPRPPYDRGFFSNGPVAVEYLVDYAGLDITDPEQYQNLAFGASWSTNLIDTVVHSWELQYLPELRLFFQGKVMPPGLNEVVSVFLARNPVLDPDVIYGLFFNGNDYLNGFTDSQIVASRQFENIRYLINAGARHIFWGMMPDYSLVPCFHKGHRRDQIISSGEEHNKYIGTFASLIRKAWPEVKLTTLDVGFIFRQIMLDPDNQFHTPDEVCTNIYIPSCERNPGMVSMLDITSTDVQQDDPEDYLFWDQVHVTNRTHRIISGYLCELIRESGYRINCPDKESLRHKKIPPPSPEIEARP